MVFTVSLQFCLDSEQKFDIMAHAQTFKDVELEQSGFSEMHGKAQK